MNYWEILHKLLTGPVELLLEVAAAMGERIISKGGIIVIFLSLLINIPALLLFRQAISQQNQAKREKQNSGSSPSGIFENIKAFFLQKTTLALLMEILLFAAGYFFFTGPYRFLDKRFGPIANLREPDKLFAIGSIQLNILPICAFCLRIVAESLFLRESNKGYKIQRLILSLAFFGVLYFSPSGFALYMLTAALLTLISALLSRLKNPFRILSLVISAVGLILLAYTAFFMQIDSPRKRLVIMSALLLTQIPLLISFFIKNHQAVLSVTTSRTDHTLFLINAVYLTILTGIQIPSMVIRSAPTDFINVSSYYSPAWYIVSASLLAAGTFLLWFGMIYMIASSPVKKITALVMTIISFWGTVNSMFYGNNRGLMSDQLVYEIMPADPINVSLINFGILILIALALFIIWKKQTVLLSLLIMLLCVTKTTSSVSNLVNIAKTLNTEKVFIDTQMLNKPEIPLSKTGKNVIVFMLDRSMGYFIPFMMAERPELMEKFDGFTFYPNTLSFATQTNEGVPALFGGYEYTPEEINERNDVLLVEKHDEALRMMPLIFDDAGYEVTVIDPPYAGYKMLSDLEIFSDRPEIHAFHAEGLFTGSPGLQKSTISKLKRNFFCYSIYRLSPLFIQPTLYTSGSYNKPLAVLMQSFDNLNEASGAREKFEQAYNVLQNLNNMTMITDENINTYLAIDNKSTHEPVLLQLPDYTITENVDNSQYESSPITRTSWDGRTIELDSVFKVTHYHGNMASYLSLGVWLDYLRENGVYDNTRIIFVADHGKTQGYKDLKFGSESYEEVLAFNPVLMVKDFNSKGFSVDEQFMTNADVPTIAMEGLISDPVNPATGNPVNNDAKTESDIIVKHTTIWDIRDNNGTTYLPDSWYRFHGEDIFDPDNWESLGVH